MSGEFEASVALAGRTLERAAARDGSRGIGVATERAGGGRQLVTVVGPVIPDEALAEHAGWDLPLLDVQRIETTSGPRTFVAEALPNGVPASWLVGEGLVGRDPLPPFAVDLANRVAGEHARGRSVGGLHAATIVVHPDSLRLAAVAQRPLRLASAIAVEGDRPLLGYATWAPGDVLGGPPSPADDVFRLGILLWQWRHGTHPLGAGSDGELLSNLAALAGGSSLTLPAPGDSLDRLLLACLAPSPGGRPRAGDVAAAIGG